jgi:hypothetical protein
VSPAPAPPTDKRPAGPVPTVPDFSPGALVERAVLYNDLARLTPADRVAYYKRVCESLGLNPLTWPFRYLYLDGKLTLYTTRDACDQLRFKHEVTIDKPTLRMEPGELLFVEVTASIPSGRADADVGVVSLKDLEGVKRANAVMKGVTKAKRRVTLSIVGLGFPDESEVEDIPGARGVTVDMETGEIRPPRADEAAPPPELSPEAQERQALTRTLEELFTERRLSAAARAAWLRDHFGGETDLDRIDVAVLADVIHKEARKPT